MFLQEPRRESRLFCIRLSPLITPLHPKHPLPRRARKNPCAFTIVNAHRPVNNFFCLLSKKSDLGL